MQSYITHEQITPIKCIIQAAEDLIKKADLQKLKNKLNYIAITAKMLFSQIKMFLDKSLIESGNFVP